MIFFDDELTAVRKESFNSDRMLARLLSLICLVVLAGCATQPKPVKVEDVQVLPLELNTKYEIRKIKRFYNEPSKNQQTLSVPAAFERSYYDWGAVDGVEFAQLRGNYYDIYWRTGLRSDVTVRLEYRQEKLLNEVCAQELYYPGARGSYRSKFKVTGDDYTDFGRVTSWRILLIVDGRIVGFRQSFLWK